MEFDKIIIDKFVEIMIEKSMNFFCKNLSKNSSETKNITDSLTPGLKIQITKALNFCSNIVMFRMPDTTSTSDHTIELIIKNQHRHFFSDKSNGKDISEYDLLIDNNNHFILGDPGAGKTTTIKRLLLTSYNILFSDENHSFPYSFPIIIRLGEIKAGDTFLTFLCKELGIIYETIERKIEYEELEDTYDQENPDKYEEKIIINTKIIFEYKIGGLAIENAVGDYINEMKTILFIDGLDEVYYTIKDDVFRDIKKLSNLLSNSKIIISSRYISEISSFKQFKKNEIVPLTIDQSNAIAKIWLDDSSIFFKKLNLLPYKDLADRPLFLSLLLILFVNNKEQLPEQAVDIYRQIVLLVIREWDDDREYKTQRYSKYKRFDTYKKEGFLSELAFQLTYELKAKKVFTSKQLESAYYKIYRRYPELNNDDVKSVIEDIETHNGLIVKSFANEYEFSHLSLQEYLCAKYILNTPFTKKHYDYLNIYPAPLAIANVLSPVPAEWFSTFLLYNVGEIQVDRQLKSDKIFEFLNRLMLENISFPFPTEELGFSVLYLYFRFGKCDVVTIINEFIRINFVKESVCMALLKYDIKSRLNKKVFLELKKFTRTDQYINFPKSGTLDNYIFDKFDLSGR